MRDLKALFSRVKTASLKRMLRNVKNVHNDKGVNSVRIFFDMIYCGFKYKVGYLDYVIFGFADIGSEKRRTFMTMDDNIYFVRKYNDRESRDIFEDKSRFNRVFAEYINRQVLDLRDAGSAEFREFCRGKTAIFAKEPVSFGGLGVIKVELEEDTDYEKLYKELMEGKLYDIEELVVQHEKMNELYPKSVNTLRICTVLHGGKVKHMYTIVRMGNGKDVDNATSGGLYTWVDNNGRMSRLAFCDKLARYFDTHPITGVRFEGFEIPFFNEAVDLCKRAAMVVPQVQYVGWDVAITPSGPVIIEGNSFTGYDMPQNHKFHEDRCGLLKQFKEAFGEV